MQLGDKVRFKDGSRTRIINRVGPDEIGEIIDLRHYPSDGENVMRANVRFPSGDVPAILISEYELVETPKR
jgi:hypothetical protein